MFKKQFTILVGEQATGKDTLLNKLVDTCNVNRIISYTSRPKRDCETEGVEYNFISKEEFETMIKKDMLLEYRQYNTLVDGIPDVWYYGLPNKFYSQNERLIVILDLIGALEFIKFYGKENCTVIYLYCPEEIRRERCIRRGDFNEQEFIRRLEDDRKKFTSEQLLKVGAISVSSVEDNLETIIKLLKGENNVYN